ncbi:hypothetical protein ASF30_19810 [Leifsonia sp. Leaf264]|nr:hypothetical protein ASF30_19810 [Leifsonia sp. Leaf264]
MVIGAAYYGAMSTRRPLAITALTAAALTVTAMLAGCTAQTGSASSASASANPTPTFTDASPSATPTPEATQVAPRDEPSPTAETPIAAAGCDTFLTEAQTSELASEGFVPDPTSTWPDVMAEAAANGGTWCAWKSADGSPGFHAGQVAIPDAVWQKKRADLVAQGALEDDASYPGFLALPDAGAPDIDGGFVYANGCLVYVSYPKLAASVTVLQ